MLIDFLIKEDAVLSAVEHNGFKFFVLELIDDTHFCLKIRPPDPLNIDELVRDVFIPCVEAHRNVERLGRSANKEDR